MFGTGLQLLILPVQLSLFYTYNIFSPFTLFHLSLKNASCAPEKRYAFSPRTTRTRCVPLSNTGMKFASAPSTSRIAVPFST